MNSDTLDAQLEQHAEGRAALESLTDDVDSTIASRSLTPTLEDLQYRRLRQIRQEVGLEDVSRAWEDAKSVGRSIRSAYRAIAGLATATGDLFGRFLDTVLKWIDTTGLRDLAEMEDMLQEFGVGEGSGTVNAPAVVKRLHVGGQLPSNFAAHTERLLALAHRVEQKVVPTLSQQVRQTSTLLASRTAKDPSGFGDDVASIMRVVAGHKLPSELYAAHDFTDTFPGGRTMFKVRKPKQTQPHPDLTDTASRRIVDEVQGATYGFNSSPHAVTDAESKTVVILSKARAGELLQQARILLQTARRLAEVSRIYRRDVNAKYVSQYLAAGMQGVLIAHADVSQQPEVDYQVDVDFDLGVATIESQDLDLARAQADWLKALFSLDVMDHQKSMEKLIGLMTAVGRSYVMYVRFCLKHYR